MGLCLTREKDDCVQYDRYIYCSTCLAKIPYDRVYIMAHCANKSFVFVLAAATVTGFMRNNFWGVLFFLNLF